MGISRGRCVFWGLVLAFWGSSAVFAAKQKGNDQLCLEALLEQAARFEEAAIGLAEGNADPVIATLRDQSTSPRQQLILWKLFSTLDFERAIAVLAEVEVSQEVKAEVLKIIAERSPAEILANFGRWQLNGELRFELAKKMAGQIPLGPHLQTLALETEAQRAEIAALQIEHGEEFLNFKEQYRIESAAAWFPILLQLAKRGIEFSTHPEELELLPPDSRVNARGTQYRKNGNGQLMWVQDGHWALVDPAGTMTLWPKVDLLSLDQKGQIALAKADAENILENLSWLAVFQQRFGAIPHSYKQKVAGAILGKAIQKNGWEWVAQNYISLAGQNYIFAECFKSTGQNYLGLTAADRMPIAIEILRNVRQKRIRERKERDQFLFDWLDKSLWSVMQVFHELRKEIFVRDATGSVAASHGLEDLEELHMVADGDQLDLTGVLRAFAKKNPDLLPEEFVEILWDKVRDPQVAVVLLREFFAQDWHEKEERPKVSLELLCQVTGLEYCAVDSAAISKNPIIFYQILTDLQKGLGRPAFEGVKIDPNVYGKKEEFLLVLRMLRDLLKQAGDGSKAWKEILESLHISSDGITAQNLEQISRSASEKLVAEIQEKLRGQNIQFTYDQFTQLEEQWGDLEPIWTLLTRFQSSQGWHQEIPVLVNVFQQVLNGQFSHFKFRNADALRQIQWMNPQAREEWEKERFMVSLHGDARQENNPEAAEEQRRFDQFKAQFVDSFLTPIRAIHGEGMGRTVEGLSNAQEEWLEASVGPFLKEKVLRADPNLATDEILAELQEVAPLPGELTSPEFLFRVVLAEMAKEGATISEVRGGLRVLSSLLSFHPLGLEEQRDGLRNTLRGFERLLKPKRVQEATEIIFSAITSAPKLLLTVGDVVNTGSCQNYRTGGIIQTLLGYVIDANVQALVSFAIKQQDFEDEAKYSEVVRAYRNNQEVAVAWEGNKRVVTFTVRLPDGGRSEIRTKPLGNGFLRQMVKLGENRQLQRPGIRLEREYAQGHAGIAKMREHHAALKQQLEQSIGAVPQGPIHITVTRNPGGVYSDSGGGQMRTEYHLN